MIVLSTDPMGTKLAPQHQPRFAAVQGAWDKYGTGTGTKNTETGKEE